MRHGKESSVHPCTRRLCAPCAVERTFRPCMVNPAIPCTWTAAADVEACETGRMSVIW